MHRPDRLVRRVLAAISPPRPGCRPLATAFGVPVLADPSKAIGRAIVTTGVYDLAVTEALARLIDPGDLVLDAGANVGYMSIVCALAAGPSGLVVSFEPHPDLVPVLRRNAAEASGNAPLAKIDVRAAALGAESGSAELSIPVAGFGRNDGIAAIRDGESTPRGGERRVAVPVETIDGVLGDRSASVLKIDVEGYEFQALRGAAGALGEGRIRHIVFEDHNGPASPVIAHLRELGYGVLALGWKLNGPVLAPADGAPVAAEYEAPNYIATTDPESVSRRLAPRGWRALSRHFRKRPA